MRILWIREIPGNGLFASHIHSFLLSLLVAYHIHITYTIDRVQHSFLFKRKNISGGKCIMLSLWKWRDCVCLCVIPGKCTIYVWTLCPQIERDMNGMEISPFYCPIPTIQLKVEPATPTDHFFPQFCELWLTQNSKRSIKDQNVVCQKCWFNVFVAKNTNLPSRFAYLPYHVLIAFVNLPRGHSMKEREKKLHSFSSKRLCYERNTPKGQPETTYPNHRTKCNASERKTARKAKIKVNPV